MYTLKLMKGNEEHMLPECRHYAVEIHEQAEKVIRGDDPADDLEVEAGITLELTTPEGEIRRVHLPTDGDVVYAMNGSGSTVATYRWPLRRSA